MKFFVTGASRYIGGSVASKLLDAGHEVLGLVRSEEKARLVDQIPKLTWRSKERGAGLYIGKGVNCWSNVHIEDLVDLYLLVLQKAPAASFFFAENGESSLKEVAESVSRSLGYGGVTQTWDAKDAIARLDAQESIAQRSSRGQRRGKRES